MVIRPFAAADQQAVRRLILAGLGEHFGTIDETCNPDLDDIQTSYLTAGNTFLVVEMKGEIVGTGALITEDEQEGRLVRMSVATAYRRQGIGQAVVAALVERAKARGFKRLVLETNQGWEDAIGLYRHCGFSESARAHGLVHMELHL